MRKLPLTESAKQTALKALAKRIDKNSTRQPARYDPNGATWYYACDTCLGEIVVENGQPDPGLCLKCRQLEENGWLPVVDGALS